VKSPKRPAPPVKLTPHKDPISGKPSTGLGGKGRSIATKIDAAAKSPHGQRTSK